MSMHIGRSWRGTQIEDDCLCPTAACGLVATTMIHPDCPEHAFEAAKTIRQAHSSKLCPSAPVKLVLHG